MWKADRQTGRDRLQSLTASQHTSRPRRAEELDALEVVYGEGACLIVPLPENIFLKFLVENAGV